MSIEYMTFVDIPNGTTLLPSLANTIKMNETTTPITPVDWGPKRDPLHIVIPITLVYVIIFITGVVGNISTCIVISRNKAMHTATNYYLFSLAISDLLLLVSGLPPEMYSIWVKYPYVFGEAFCVIQGFAAETSANATVLTITAFTVERYVAICHPFLSHTMSKLSRAIKFIVAVWIVAMCLAVPQAMSFEIFSGDGDEQYVCIVNQTVIPHAFGISTMLFFVIPMSLITILYVLIGLQLHKSTVGPSRGNSVRMKHRVVSYTPTSTQPVIMLNGNNANGGGAGHNQENVVLSAPRAHEDEDGRKNFARNAQATKHVVKMLVAVVVAFFICWAPFHAQRLFAIYSGPPSENMISAYRILTYISGVLYYLSTSINPFLYHIMSHKFREAFKDTFKGFLRRKGRSTGSRCYSTLSGRSSQINSHSNTDSCSRQSSLRYLEAEMARLHDSKRPLVVSFKRKKSAYPKKAKQVTILDAELQEALDNLNEETMRRDLFEKVRQHFDEDDAPSPILATRTLLKCHTSTMTLSSSTVDRIMTYIDTDEVSSENPTEFSYVEVHNLQPTHICPMNGRHLHHNDEHKEFKEQKCKKGRKYRQHHHHYRGEHDAEPRKCKVTWNNELTKSSTMPHMANEVESAGNDKEPNKQRNDEITTVLVPAICSHSEHATNYNRRDERSNSCSHLEFRSLQGHIVCGTTNNNGHGESIIIPVT